MKTIYFLFTLVLLFTGSNLFSQNPEWIVYTKDSLGMYNDNDNSVGGIRIDSMNRKWFGGFSRPLIIRDNNSWHIYKYSLPKFGGVSDICFNYRGSVWLAALSLYKFGQNDTTYYWLTDTSKHNPNFSAGLVSLAADTQYLWIGTRSGLFRFDGTNFTVYDSAAMGDIFYLITSTKLDRNGNLWIGTDSGLIKFDGTNFTKWTTSNSPLPYRTVNSITIDDSDYIWLTFTDYDDKLPAKIAKFKDSTWTIYDSTNSLLNGRGQGTNICFDSSGIMWVSTLSGILKKEGSQWTRYSTSNSGLPSNMVFSCNLDINGNLWMGTFNGLAVYKEGGVDFSSGRQDQGGSNALTAFYPNPAEKNIRINYNIDNPSAVSCEIFDNTGQLIKSVLNKTAEPGEYNEVINTSTLPSGSYLFKMRIGNRIETKKIIINK